MRLDYVSTKTLNFPYITGKKALLSVDNDDVSAMVFYCDDKRIGVSIPHVEGMAKKSSFVVTMLYMDKMLEISGKFINFDDGILYLKMPRHCVFNQQRGALRVDVDIKCMLEKITEGKIKNLSASGAFIALSSPIGEKLIADGYFKLCFTIEGRDLRIKSRIIEMTDKYVRVEFTDFSDEVHEFLTQYCCRKDDLLYRGSKNEG